MRPASRRGAQPRPRHVPELGSRGSGQWRQLRAGQQCNRETDASDTRMLRLLVAYQAGARCGSRVNCALTKGWNCPELEPVAHGKEGQSKLCEEASVPLLDKGRLGRAPASGWGGWAGGGCRDGLRQWSAPGDLPPRATATPQRRNYTRKLALPPGYRNANCRRLVAKGWLARRKFRSRNASQNARVRRRVLRKRDCLAQDHDRTTPYSKDAIQGRLVGQHPGVLVQIGKIGLRHSRDGVQEPPATVRPGVHWVQLGRSCTRSHGPRTAEGAVRAMFAIRWPRFRCRRPWAALPARRTLVSNRACALPLPRRGRTCNAALTWLGLRAYLRVRTGAAWSRSARSAKGRRC